MVRGLFSVGGFLLALSWIHPSVRSAVAEWGGLEAAGRVWEIDAAFQRGFRSDAMLRLNRLRGGAEIEEIRGDESIQAFLGEWVTAHDAPETLELDEVFDGIQRRFPGAQYLAAHLVTAKDREDLLAKLSVWPAALNPEFDSVNTAAFSRGGKIGVLAVMSRRIPEFSLRAANEGGGRFHNRCPHCRGIHALELNPDSRTLILSCPHCDLPFDLLAVGTGGRVRRATDFFDGFTLPETPLAETTAAGTDPAASGSEEDRLVALWRQIAARCRYELDQNRPDATGGGAREVWKSSSETWREAAGDCEDSSILLADVLIGAGFDARVAIGWNGNIGQHAWVVVRTEDRQVLLETTLQREIGKEQLVDVKSVAAFYQPEQLFDADRIYYTTARPEKFAADYFSESLWKAIPREGSLSRR